MSDDRIESLFMSAEAPIKEAIVVIDRSRRLGVALVVDAAGRLVNTLTDGDVRRGILAGLSLEAPVAQLLEIKRRMPHPDPVVAPAGSSRDERLRIMMDNAVRQLPVVDSAGRVVAIEAMSELLEEPCGPLKAVVMAGGLGRRLRPLTENTPKPMLPIGGRPVMELLVERLRRAGVRQLHVSTHFHSEKIIDHFGDGSGFGIQINYLEEDDPLGTAGALGLMPVPESDVLVLNGDLVTEVDFTAMFDYHRQNRAVLTMGIRAYEHVVPYGVVELREAYVQRIREKPTQACFVNAGMYVLAPEAFSYVRRAEHLDMPELIERLLAAGRAVVGFPIREKWIDIGQYVDYARANGEATTTPPLTS
jgi:dTDP-glucose pyrophosphorylase/CBS domain-containing protein